MKRTLRVILIVVYAALALSAMYVILRTLPWF